MRRKMVMRFYCDHCSRGGFRKQASLTHERNCIYNPARTCATCEEFGLLTLEMPKLMEFLEDSLLACRRAAQGCPTCILAAIVQSRAGIERFDDDGGHFEEFDYKKELHEFRYPNMAETPNEEPAF